LPLVLWPDAFSGLLFEKKPHFSSNVSTFGAKLFSLNDLALMQRFLGRRFGLLPTFFLLRESAFGQPFMEEDFKKNFMGSSPLIQSDKKV